jgi:glycosyltransferase involved in cell wall biosynthesis
MARISCRLDTGKPALGGITDEIQPDILHVHNSLRTLIPLLTPLQSHRLKMILHLLDELPVETSIRADAFVGCSQYIVDFYEDKPRRATHRACIHNGVDLDRFRPYHQDLSVREGLRRKFRIQDEDFIVLYVGRVSLEKGVAVILYGNGGYGFRTSNCCLEKRGFYRKYS